MKQLFFLVFLINIFDIWAQNWQIVIPNKSYYYSETGDSIVKKNVRIVKSFQLFDSAIYIMNPSAEWFEVKKPNYYPDSINLKGKGIFGDSIFRQKNTWYLGSKVKIILKSDSGIAVRYTPASPQEPDSAVFECHRQRKIFENTFDSVKVFRFGKDDSIVVSKNFGIINFSMSAINSHYQLVGCENDETKSGLCPLSFKEYFDFKPGDAFFYDEHNAPCCGWAHGYGKKYKMEVLNKRISGDTLFYKFNFVGYGYTFYPFFITWELTKTYFNFTKEHYFIPAKYHPCNTKPGDIAIAYFDLLPLEYSDTSRQWARKRNVLGRVNLWTDHKNTSINIGLGNRLNQSNYKSEVVAFVHDSVPDLLDNDASMLSLYTDYEIRDYISFEYEKSRGLTYFDEYLFEGGYGIQQVGYVSGSDTIGIAPKAWQLYDAVNEIEVSKKFKLLSNASNHKLDVIVTTSLKTNYEVITLSGQTVGSGKLTAGDNEIYIQNLTNGLYLLRIQNHEQNMVFKFLKF